MTVDEGESRGSLEVGLLWYDADPRRPVETKIAEAAERHEEKFGTVPNVCHVSPEASQKLERQIAGTRVMANRWIRPNYFWLGVDPELPRPRAVRQAQTPRQQPATRADERKSASAPSGRRVGSVLPKTPPPGAATKRAGIPKSPEPRQSGPSARRQQGQAGTRSRSSVRTAK